MARLKVVAHKKTGQIVKGYAELAMPLDAYGNPGHSAISFPSSVNLDPADHTKPVTIPTDTLKALFFVKSFDGDPSYAETKFFNPEPNIEGLWVHLTFHDGEVTEGIVHNGLELLNDPGFLMKPPDPQSNNNAVYVMKSALSRFLVVGVKANY
jgi:hypothetical protein